MQQIKDEVRIDKFLWAVRIFKTRNLASEACKKNRVIVNDVEAKSSRMVRTGDEIRVKKPPVMYTYKVLAAIENRVGAKLVEHFIIDTTPQSELDKIALQKESSFFSPQSAKGRPTKKDRRNYEKFLDKKDTDDFDLD